MIEKLLNYHGLEYFLNKLKALFVIKPNNGTPGLVLQLLEDSSIQWGNVASSYPELGPGSSSSTDYVIKGGGATNTYLNDQGNWTTPTNTTYLNLTSVSSASNSYVIKGGGTSGLFLQADGTWTTPSGTTYLPDTVTNTTTITNNVIKAEGYSRSTHTGTGINKFKLEDENFYYRGLPTIENGSTSLTIAPYNLYSSNSDTAFTRYYLTASGTSSTAPISIGIPNQDITSSFSGHKILRYLITCKEAAVLKLIGVVTAEPTEIKKLVVIHDCSNNYIEVGAAKSVLLECMYWPPIYHEGELICLPTVTITHKVLNEFNT